MSTYLDGLFRDARRRFTPFLDWIFELKDPAILRADVLAGITVALVLIPQAMANAQLAGLPPETGLYSAFLIPIVAALFGSSRQLQNGPVAIISLMSAAALIPLDLTRQEYIAYAAMLAVLAGVFQLLLGFLRLGLIVDFLSHPVIIGFTNAAAIVIGSLQLGKLFGIENDSGGHLYETLWHLLRAIPSQSHSATVLMGFVSLFLLIVLKRVAPKFPGILVTVVLATVLSWGFDFQTRGGKIVGEVSSGLPAFVFPSIKPGDLQALLLPAFMIAILSFVEAFSIAKAVAGKTRQHLSANQEMVGKGLANVLAGVSQGYAVSGSFSRTAVAYDAGAKTGFTAIVSGMIVGLTLVFFTDLLFYIPLATLAAVIIVAVAGMIQFRPLIHAWKVNPHDGLVALVVFLGTLLFAPHLEWGIIIGISLSIALYIFRTMRPHFAELALDSDGTYRDAQRLGLETSATVALFRFDGDLYFANASYLERELLNAVADKPDLKVLVLDLVGIDQIDATGEEMLTHMAERLNEAGIRFVITRAKFAVVDMLKRSGLYDKIGSENFFRKRDVALAEIKKKYGSEIDITHLEDNIPIE